MPSQSRFARRPSWAGQGAGALELEADLADPGEVSIPNAERIAIGPGGLIVAAGLDGIRVVDLADPAARFAYADPRAARSPVLVRRERDGFCREIRRTRDEFEWDGRPSAMGTQSSAPGRPAPILTPVGARHLLAR